MEIYSLLKRKFKKEKVNNKTNLYYQTFILEIEALQLADPEKVSN